MGFPESEGVLKIRCANRYTIQPYLTAMSSKNDYMHYLNCSSRLVSKLPDWTLSEINSTHAIIPIRVLYLRLRECTDFRRNLVTHTLVRDFSGSARPERGCTLL